MEWIINQLRVHPELAIFLTLFAGFWLGRLKIGKFSLGTVTSVLLVGVLVGQLNITVDGPMKTVFFLLFLFIIRRLICWYGRRNSTEMTSLLICKRHIITSFQRILA